MYTVSWLLCATLLWADDSCASLDQVEEVAATVYEDVRGIYWYSVLYHGKPIGHLQLEHKYDRTVGYVVTRILTFRVTEGRKVAITEVFEFSDQSPHRLTFASKLVRTSQGLVGYRSGQDIAVKPSNAKEFAGFNYLSLTPFHESLTNNRRKLEIPQLNFETRSLDVRHWQFDNPNSNPHVRYVSTTDDYLTHVLSPKGIPKTSHYNEGIELQLAGRNQATAWEQAPPLLDAEIISIPVDQPIVNHKRLTRLSLHVEADPDTLKLWQPVLGKDQVITIDLDATEPYGGEHDMVKMHYEALETPPVIVELIAKANIALEPIDDSIQKWVEFLQDYITYQEVDTISDIEQTLTRRYGDCTEFADVFHHVALAQGWLSRTRTGLAYNAKTHSFQSHAWNEVVINDHWVSVDASWGQFPADASHVPFPTPDILALYASASRTKFNVVDRAYRSAGSD